jgi:hypothetical protein
VTLTPEQLAVLRSTGPDRVRDRLMALMAAGKLAASIALGKGLWLIDAAKGESR